MQKIEPIKRTVNMPDIILGLPVNGSIQVHADRLASFKSSVSRVNSQSAKGVPKLLFSYSGTVDNYVTATRIA